ncbi:hypothetical protein PP707_06730 [Acetobacter pasteurianus]|nr:hypothetical protein [Acetobacter pasteurianus]
MAIAMAIAVGTGNGCAVYFIRRDLLLVTHTCRTILWHTSQTITNTPPFPTSPSLPPPTTTTTTSLHTFARILLLLSLLYPTISRG